MNREIKFRGKRVDNDEWVYGYLVFSEDYIFDYSEIIYIPYIIPIDNFNLKDYREYRVDGSTIGQYTGLKDKNGKEIYEGDLIRYKNGGIEEIDEVFFDKEYGTFETAFNRNKSNSATLGFWIADLDEESSYEIIGNIYDRR